jgi:hypothetical protein
VLTPAPAAPEKSSLNTVVKPDGGAGTDAWAPLTWRVGPAAATTSAVTVTSHNRRRRAVGASLMFFMSHLDVW